MRRIEPVARSSKLLSLKLAIKELRRVYTGFDAKDGYNLANLKALDSQRARKVEALTTYLRTLKSRPAKPVRARVERSKKALREHTGQRHRQQKVFLVHTDKPDKTRVRVRQPRVETETLYTGKDGKEHTRTQRDYYFLFPKKLVVWDDILTATEKLIDKLKPGYYRIVSSLYGPVGSPMNRDNLLRNMQASFDSYGSVRSKANSGRDTYRCAVGCA